MKNIVVILVLVAALGMGGYFGYQHFIKSSTKDDIAEMVPEGAMAVIQFSDIQMNLSKWTSTPLWNHLINIDYEAIAMKASDDTKAVSDFLKIQKAVEEISSNEIFKKVFDKEVTMIIYPAKLNLAQMSEVKPAQMFSKMSDMLSSFVFVLKVPLEIQMAEFVGRFSKDLGPNITQSEEKYKGSTIHLIHYDDMNASVGYVRIGETIIIGFGKKAAQNSIDVLEKEKLSLSEDENFNDIQSQFLENSGVRLYWNIENSIDLFVDEMRGMRSKIESQSVSSGGSPGVRQWQDIEKAISQMKRNFSGFKAWGISMSLDETAQMKMDMVYNPNGLSADLASLYDKCSPTKNSTANFVPGETLSYYWFSCFDLKYYWSQVQKEFDNLPAQQVESATQKIAQFEAVVGMSIGELLGAFGSEMGGYIKDLKTGGVFPTPLLTLFIEVGDKLSMDQLLTKLHEMPMVMLKDESYGGTTINYLGMQFGPDIQPAYAYVGNYLLFSISRKLLKESIDLHSDSANSLVNAFDYTSSPLNLLEPNNGVVFMQIGEFTGKIKGFLEWANQWATAQARKKKAFAAGSEKRLADEQKKVEDLDVLLIKLDDELWNKESREGVDPAEITALKNDIEIKKKELITAREEVASLEGIFGQHHDGQSEQEQRDYMLENLVNPVLDAFTSVGVAATRSVMNKGHIEINFSVDIGL